MLRLRFFFLRSGSERIPNRLASNFAWRRDTDVESEELPRITCPKKLRDKLDKYKMKKLGGEKDGKSQPKGPLVISCKRKDYNFYQGERFDGSNVHKLVSCGWKNTKRVGDSFTLVPYLNNPSLHEDSETSFHDLGINEKLCGGLQDLGLTSPTAIQKRAIPSLLRGDNAVCAAETGSGKTLAYLLPTVEWILRQKHDFRTHNQISDSHTPNTIIITPNRELTEQVMSVAESLTPYADFVPHCILGGENARDQIRRHQEMPMDILVSTPGVLRKLLKARCIRGTGLQHFIIDESDTLLDDSFVSDLQEIFHLLQMNPVDEVDSQLPLLGGTQMVLVSATMPRDVEHALGNILPIESLNKITTPGLHQLQPHVPQKFIRVNPASKPEKLIQLIKEKAAKNHPTLVFANNNKTCYYLSKLLEENGIDCLRMSGDMAQRDRKGVFQKFKKGYSDVLVATDIASRGLDTTNVHHVINYDFPTFMSDYIHRVGRVGRVGVKHIGQVTSFVTHKWDVELLWKIETAARTQTKLDEVNANIKKLLMKAEPEADEFELNIL